MIYSIMGSGPHRIICTVFLEQSDTVQVPKERRLVLAYIASIASTASAFISSKNSRTNRNIIANKI